MADKNGKSGANGGSANTSKKNATTQQGQGEQKKEKKALSPALVAINKEAKKIREKGGKKTETKVVEKYVISHTDALKQAAAKIKAKDTAKK